MRIAIDARELLGRPTGVGRYLAELLACWTRSPDASRHALVLIAPNPLSDLSAGVIGRGGATVAMEVVPGSGRVGWEQGALARAAKRVGAEVLFCPGYSGPALARMPMVVAIHDVSFWAHPEWFGPREGLRRRVTTWAAARRARTVLTISEFSRDEIVRWIGIPVERIRVTPLAAGGFFDPVAYGTEADIVGDSAGGTPASDVGSTPSGAEATGATASPNGSPGPNAGTGPRSAAAPPAGTPASQALVLTVGTILPRRHVDVLLRAFARVLPNAPHARLAIVGENRTQPPQDFAALARDLGIAERVALRSYVPDAELRSLYAAARAFVFLSTYEGFGLTPLEALSAGIPTLVYDTAVSREIYGDAAARAPIGDVEAVATHLRAMLTAPPDAAARARLAQTMRLRYDWHRTAAATLAAIEEAARS